MLREPRTSRGSCCSTSTGSGPTGATALIADYDLAGTAADPALGAVQGALRLSGHVLNQDKAQLPSQLLGRLLSCKTEHVQPLLDQARNWKAAPWLCPLTGSLTQAGGPLLLTLAGHTAGVKSVAVTPDGRRAISASKDKTLRVWDLDSGAELRTLAGHADVVHSVALTPDGRWAVSASNDNSLKVWDLDSGAELRTLAGHSNWVQSVAVTPDGRRAVSASFDKTLKVWDLEIGTVVVSFIGEGTITACAVALDGTIVAGETSGRVHFLRLIE